MSETFAEKLDFILKALSTTRGRLAADLVVDKSIVGRWLTGAVHPSPHSLSRVTAWMATRIDGFNTLDWERSLESLAALMGVAPGEAPGSATSGPRKGLALPLMAEILQTTARRGQAYEGFYRSTRPYAQRPGRFMHDQLMIRMDREGLLRFEMGSGGVTVMGWVLPLQNQLFVVASELTSGAMAFGIMNGVNTVRAGVIDGLILTCALDPGRTPTASAVIFERTGDLSGDEAAEDRLFADLVKTEPLAPDGSVPVDIQEHLARNVGPGPLADGGDWLLRMPLARSRSDGISRE